MRFDIRRRGDDNGDGDNGRGGSRRGGAGRYLFLGGIIIIILIVGSGFYTLSTWGSVDAGYASLIKNTYNGQIRAGPVGPINAPFVKSPFYEEVVPIKVAVDSVYMWSKFDNNDIETSHGDWEAPVGQTQDKVNLAVDINAFWTVSPQPDKLINLYLKFPLLNYKDTVIIPIIRETIRDVMVNYTFDQVFQNRAILGDQVAKIVTTKISANPDLQGAIIISPSSINILEIRMPYQIAQAQNQRKQSEIGIQTAANNRLSTIINASAAQNATIINAQGFARARIIEANATRASIDLILRSICNGNKTCESQAGQLYLQLIQLKEIAQANPNIIFFVGMQGNQPIIWQLPSKKP